MTRMQRPHRVLWVLMLALGTPLLLAQQPPAQNVIISGRVVAADDGALVLRGARITLNGGPAVAAVFTDAAGEFRLSVPAEYSLGISKTGFAPAVITGRASGKPSPLVVRLERGAVIEGQVVDTSGFPVHNARVRARRVDAAGGGRDVVADADDAGAYRIGSLPAGRYELHTERAPIDNMSPQAFVEMQMHEQMEQRMLVAPVRPMSATTSVELKPGAQSIVTLVHQTYAVLPPDAPIGGFISGAVIDEFGDPLEGVNVRLLQLRYSGDRYVADPVGAPRRTDDRGRYRFFWARPGRYVVAATAADARVAPVYYPGVTTISLATPIDVGRTQELNGITIQFRRTAEARVYGFAVNAAGDAWGGRLMLQARRRAGQVALTPQRVAVNRDATFEFLNVPPGDYVLATDPGLSRGEFAQQLITVEGPDVPPVTMRAAPMATVTGRIELEGTGTAPPLLQAVPDPDYPLLPSLSSSADGSFQMRFLAGPVRFTLPNPPPGMWLKAVNIGGVNAVEQPVVFNGPDSSRTDVRVVFASSAGEVSGKVLNERGDRAEDYRVLVFSTTRERWYAGSQFVRLAAGPDADDGFTVASLPPGDYFAVAVDGIDGSMNAGDWQNPEVLAALSTRAQRVTVGEHQRASADLRLIRWAR
jgi:hypothetical protein